MSCTGLQNKASPSHTRACARLPCSLQRDSDKAMAREMHWNMMWDGDCFALLSAIAPLQHTEELPRNLGLPRPQTALIHSHSPHQTQDVGVKDSSQCMSVLRTAKSSSDGKQEWLVSEGYKGTERTKPCSLRGQQAHKDNKTGVRCPPAPEDRAAQAKETKETRSTRKRPAAGGGARLSGTTEGLAHNP